MLAEITIKVVVSSPDSIEHMADAVVVALKEFGGQSPLISELGADVCVHSAEHTASREVFPPPVRDMDRQ